MGTVIGTDDTDDETDTTAGEFDAMWAAGTPVAVASEPPAQRRGKPAIEVERRERGWVRQEQGTTRAGSVHRTETEAIAAARKQALREGASVVIKGADGRIVERMDIGAEARRRSNR